MKRFLSVLIGISVLIVFAAVNTSDINGQVRAKPQKLKRVKALKLTGIPRIIMKRSALESPRSMKVYKINTLKVNTNLINKLNQKHFLKLKPAKKTRQKSAAKVRLYSDKKKDFTRMLVHEKRGHIQLLPNLKKLETVRVNLLQKGAAMNAANNYINSMKLLPKDVSSFTPKKVVTLNNAQVQRGRLNRFSYKKQGQGKLQSVLFQRSIGDKSVMGKGSRMVVNLGDSGKVEGFQRSWNHLSPTTFKPAFRSGDEVYNRIAADLKRQFKGGVTIEVGTPKLLYYDNDKRYVQPAYFYTAKIISNKTKVVSYFAGVVGALKNSPEPIAKSLKIAPSGLPNAPLSRVKGLKLRKKMAPVPFDDPYVGRYVNRDDSIHWVGDANDFKNGLLAGRPSYMPAITFPQYYWNYPRLFQSQDNYFVDRCHIVLMEGHGANWLFSTLRNCCDLVDLNSTSQPGYGGHAGGRMTFLILKSCSVVPALPDRTDWPKPWWRIFKGLRQAIGFRTTMYINDDISYKFGFLIARNCRVLDSWFQSTNSCDAYRYQRSTGGSVTGYGAVVMIPGHEGDTIYNISAAPSATTTGLTIWWQH
jgi:hypothetical protein